MDYIFFLYPPHCKISKLSKINNHKNYFIFLWTHKNYSIFILCRRIWNLICAPSFFIHSTIITLIPIHYSIISSYSNWTTTSDIYKEKVVTMPVCPIFILIPLFFFSQTFSNLDKEEFKMYFLFFFFLSQQRNHKFPWILEAHESWILFFMANSTTDFPCTCSTNKETLLLLLSMWDICICQYRIWRYCNHV